MSGFVNTTNKAGIEKAVENYLTKNPVQSGATSEQAAQIEKNTSDIGSLKDTIEDEIRFEKDVNTVNLVKGAVYNYNGYYDFDGTLKTASGMQAFSLKDDTNNNWYGKKIKIKYTAVSKTFDYLAFGFFDSDGVLIKGIPVFSNSEGEKIEYIEVPQSYNSIKGSLLVSFIEYDTNKDELEKFAISNYQLIDLNSIISDYELGSAGISQNANTFITNYISVKAGETIYISSNFQGIGAMRLCTYDEQYKQLTFDSYSSTSNPPTSFVIDENVSFIRASMNKTYMNTAIIQRDFIGDWKQYGSFTMPNLIVGNKNLLKQQSVSTWSEKKWVVYGDSISTYDWFSAPATKLGLSVYKGGIGGSTASGETETSGCSDTRINAFPDDTALVTVMFGANDWSQNVPIGTLPDILKSDDKYDTNTYIGAMATIVQKVTLRFPKALIVLMTPSFRVADASAEPQTEPIQSDQTIIQFGDAVKEVGRRFGCPVIDTYAEMGINILNRQYFMSDLVHPDTLMKQRFSSLVYNRLRGLAPLENNYVYSN